MRESMKHNFSGRIKNFQTPSDPFISIDEAINNSMQALELGGIENGIIQVHITRLAQPLVEGGKFPIASIKITDNGIGFTSHNMESFLTLDSIYKANIGGKGVGRLNWLKTFDRVKVTSVYEEESKRLKKTFSFSLENEIDDIVTTETDEKIETIIELCGLKPAYYKHSMISLNDIADKILQNFTSHFVIGLPTKIYVQENDEIIELNKLFDTEKFVKSTVSDLDIEGNKYEIRHVFLKSAANEGHQIFVCAHNRVVKSFKIKSVEELPTSFNVDNHKAIYQCFVSSPQLDNDVNQERNGFNSISFEKSMNDDLFGNGLNIYNKVVEAISLYLDDYLEPLKTEKMEIIHNFIVNNAPEYGYLYKKSRPELESIPYQSTSSHEKMSVELYKIKQRIDYKNMLAVNEAVRSDNFDVDKINTIVENVTDSAKSELVTYVARRKWVIDLLKRKYAYNELGKYYDEEDLHKLFFPMRADDTSIDYDQHNLWLIDERLSYSYKFFSDLRFKKFLFDSKSSKRPDGVFFETVAFTDSTNGKANNVIIIEFKRPGRDDFSMEDNPFNQIFKYVDELKKQTATTKDGAVITLDSQTKYVGYIIADITRSLEDVFPNFDVNPSSDGLTYFAYFTKRNLFIEIIPYSAIIDNAQKRNSIFFQKLGI
ncbi:MAG: hypothetical protein KKH01_00165 [Firmicutes bacterium]|nr:hypothetical protein [Bacillota bacterium]